MLKIGKCYQVNVNCGLFLDDTLDNHAKMFVPKNEKFILLNQIEKFDDVLGDIIQVKILYKEKIYYTFLRNYDELKHFIEL